MNWNVQFCSVKNIVEQLQQELFELRKTFNSKTKSVKV